MKHRLTFALIALTYSCSEKQPTNIIEKERFETIYVELVDSAAVSEPSSSDSTNSPTAERILNRHNVTIEQFKATVRSYNSDTREWKEFYENVIRKIDDRKQKKSPQ